MKIEYLNINEYTYRIEYIPYSEFGLLEDNHKNFVMLRNFRLINNIATDDNIYFIERNIFETYKNKLATSNPKDIIDEIVFPSNKDTMYYSPSYNIFNDTYIDDDIINELAVYDILEKTINPDDNTCTFTRADIPCDLVKIYHPVTKVNQNFIIHIENFINNIHFHYLCQTKQWYYNQNSETKYYSSDTEYRYKNNIYSEYIKCYIPSIEKLFDRQLIDKDTYDYKLYFKEDLNIVDTVSDKNTDFLNKSIIKLDRNNKISTDENNIVNQYVPIALFCQPWGIEEYDEDYNNNGVFEREEKLFKKVYFKYRLSIDNNYITTPLNVSLYPYNNLNKTTLIYTLSDNYLPGTCSFITQYNFTLSALCDFDHNGIISIIGHFHYPEEEFFKTNYPNQSLYEAYCFYHHIIDRKVYTNDNLKETYIEELSEINNISDISDESISYLVESGKAKPGLSKFEYIQKLKESRWELFLEDYIEEYKASIDFFGFRIEFASDRDFNHLFYSENININQIDKIINEDGTIDIFKSLGDGHFFFNIYKMFNDWVEMPSIVVCRLIFIDRFIGMEIMSNEVYISKEKFKYILPPTDLSNKNRLDNLVELNQKIFNNSNPMIELNLNNKTNNDTFESILENISDENIKLQLEEWYKNYTPYSFINNINCSITRNEDSSDIKSNQIIKNTQIIYKPIFFKTNQLNNITIKYMQNQHIGIDLHEYMSKVDLFIMTLDGNTYDEIGRNVNYVIFNIPAVQLTNQSGTFEIYNQDHEYITYGNWSVIK